jgi:hypothetical protein
VARARPVQRHVPPHSLSSILRLAVLLEINRNWKWENRGLQPSVRPCSFQNAWPFVGAGALGGDRQRPIRLSRRYLPSSETGRQSRRRFPTSTQAPDVRTIISRPEGPLGHQVELKIKLK